MSTTTPIKIIIAENHKIFRESLSEHLSRMADLAVIDQAANGRELLEKLKTVRPDAILLDLQIPEISSVECIEVIKKIFPSVRIIVLITLSMKRMADNIMQSGANGFVLKNASLKQIANTIREVMKYGVYFEESKEKTYIKEVFFSAIELEIIKFICEELTSTEIAERLGLTVRSMDGYRRRILEKMNARNAAGIAIYALSNNLI